MKKIVALLLAVALILACTAALAELPISVTAPGTSLKAAAWYPADWTPNFDGTHTQKGKTVPCDYEVATYGNTTVKACPVCGDINGEKVELCKSRYLQFDRLYDIKKADKYYRNPADMSGVNTAYASYDDGTADGVDKAGILWNFAYLTNGQYMVRILKMPEDSDVAYVVTTCHEIAGKAYDAECVYSYMLPLDGTGLTVKKAYFGGVRDIKAEVKTSNSGLYFKPYACEDAFGMFLLVK